MKGRAGQILPFARRINRAGYSSCNIAELWNLDIFGANRMKMNETGKKLDG
jgi:hypothetical protein